MTDIQTPPIAESPTRGERTRTHARGIIWGIIWAVSAIAAIAGYIGGGGLEGAVAFFVAMPAAACLIAGSEH